MGNWKRVLHGGIKGRVRMSSRVSQVLTWFRVVFELSRVTFLDIIRDKILYNSLFFALIIFAFGILASQFTVSHPDRMVLDLGLAGVSLSLNFLSLLMGAGMLSKEIERRTLYVTLSRPITRMQFILGKYLGLAQIILMNWIFLSLSYTGLLLFFRTESDLMTQALVVGLGFAFLEALILGAVSLLFSTFTTTSLSVMFCIGVYLIGKNMTEFHSLMKRTDRTLYRIFFKGITYFVPNLEQYSLGSQVTYGIAVPQGFILTTVLYTGVVILVSLSLSGLIFNQREL